jgi:hypothetical protein
MKAKFLKLALALALVVGASLASAPKAESACYYFCEPNRWCCCGKVPAYDSCTGNFVCASWCIY